MSSPLTQSEKQALIVALAANSLVRSAIEKIASKRAETTMRHGRDVMALAMPQEEEARKAAIESQFWEGLVKTLEAETDRD